MVLESEMDPVWEMMKRLWFTDEFVERENADFHAVRDVFIKTPIEGCLGGTSSVADLAYKDQLHLINVPTHIIAAGADPATPVDHSYAIYERINGSSLDVIEGQRHFSHVEVPDQFNSLLRQGLDKMALSKTSVS